MIRQALLTASFLALILVACGAWTPPPAWTLRADGHIRANQRKEDFSLEDFLDKVKKEENQEFVYVVTPAGELAISNELAARNAKIIELQNELDDCHAR